MKGYLRIEKDPELGKYASNWYYDDEDPDESAIVLDLRKICLVADASGNAIPTPRLRISKFPRPTRTSASITAADIQAWCVPRRGHRGTAGESSGRSGETEGASAS